MDRGAWWAAVHGVAKSQTPLSDFTFTFPFHALEKEMATHSSVLAWRMPGTGEPDGLPSMGSHRVRHDWSDLAAAHKLLQFISLTPFVWPRVTKATPIPDAPTYFTDGSNNGKAGITQPEEGKTLVTPYTLAQWVVLVAVITVLVSKDKTPINIVSDSAYVVGITKSIETAQIKHVSSEELFLLFLQLQKLFVPISFLFLITHIRAHYPLPGPPHLWQFSGWSFKPIYTSKAFKAFCSLWSICHSTGIPYNPSDRWTGTLCS